MLEKKYIITIDGPAGAGKSTVSKAVARMLGYLYIDTGAMYRAIAWKAMKHNIDFTDEEKIVTMAVHTTIDLKHHRGAGFLLDIIIDGQDVTDDIRTEEVSQRASKVSGIQGVRRELQKKQREMGRNGGIVMEGRDIGTVVFPQAEFKFYIDASIKERALRRYRELKAKGQNVHIDDIESDLHQRDTRDSTRKTDPLRKAEDSMYIDSTGLSIEETAQVVIDCMRKKSHG